MLNLTNDQKLEVLRQALDERCKSIHTIRERVQSISIWILGLFVTAGGWLLQSDKTLACREQIFFSAIILISVIFLHIFYLGDLEKGFKTQQRIQAKIEDTLGLCSPGTYSQDSIYPKEWAKAGTKDSKGNFFFHNYVLIYFATAILLTCVWFK
jgi:hypothetical protein